MTFPGEPLDAERIGRAAYITFLITMRGMPVDPDASWRALSPEAQRAWKNAALEAAGHALRRVKIPVVPDWSAS